MTDDVEAWIAYAHSELDSPARVMAHCRVQFATPEVQHRFYRRAAECGLALFHAPIAPDSADYPKLYYVATMLKAVAAKQFGGALIIASGAPAAFLATLERRAHPTNVVTVSLISANAAAREEAVQLARRRPGALALAVDEVKSSDAGFWMNWRALLVPQLMVEYAGEEYIEINKVDDA